MRLWGNIKVALFVATVALCCSIEIHAQQSPPQIVGVIEAYEGHARDYILRRLGKTKPVGLLLSIEEGDEVVVLREEGVLVIRYTDRSSERIIKAQSPFRARLHGRPVGLGDKTMGLLERAGLWASDKQENDVSPAGTRGPSENDPPEWLIPGLADGKARVGQGDRRLGLAWVGGKSPYQMRIKGPDEATLLDARIGGIEVLSIQPRKLVRGRHEALVQDANGRRLVGSFTVVEANDIPVREIHALEWLAPDVVKAISARALAQKDSGAWCYEAYLSLIGAEKDFPLAKQLRRGICD